MARKGVSEMLSSSIKATLLSWEAGVSGMRLGEVAGHPWSKWDFEKVFGKASGKEAAREGNPNTFLKNLILGKEGASAQEETSCRCGPDASALAFGKGRSFKKSINYKPIFGASGPLRHQT